MMKVTERLKAEHGVLLMLLDHLEDVLRSGADAGVLQATTAAVAAAEEKHALFEERLLFRLLGASFGPASPLLSSLLEEHARIAELSRFIQSGTFDEARWAPTSPPSASTSSARRTGSSPSSTRSSRRRGW